MDILTVIAVFILGVSVGIVIGASINSKRINETIAEAKKQMELSRKLIEENEIILNKK